MEKPENQKYQPSNFEAKWIAKWQQSGIYKTPKVKVGGKKRYILDMFPYPSGAGLHVGHVEGYTATDIYSRFSRMQGYSVLHPMGFDSFGLPAENYAVKTGKHPEITTEEAIASFTTQMQQTGLSYDWDLLLAAHRPNYYKWTQWLFLFLYQKGLAYRKKQAVNWCPGCQTVLANEQVVDGKCERCESSVVQKDMEQWFFKITNYAERLLNDLQKLDWPESTKLGQINWIGKSEGLNITYKVQDTDLDLTVFTTRPDTNFGATFVVVAPDSQFVKQNLAKFPNKAECELYVSQALKKRDLERVSDSKEKTGVNTGLFAINNLNGAKMPIYIGDFALGSVGTGCLVGVPGHDKRDFEFAKAMGLPIVRVVSLNGETGPIESLTQVQEEDGVMVNSDFLNGLNIHDATVKVMDHIELKGWGKRVTNYKLRDWLISRQRFWGAPIPMKYTVNAAGEREYTPVEMSELPVTLPMDVEFKPSGRSPLNDHKDFVGREADTMDTFVCSSWYYFRFAQLTNESCNKASKSEKEENPFEISDITADMQNWCPVDLYVGGAEHTVLHLLYSRFITKVLFDEGLIKFDEPFLKLRHQGIIMGPDHRKMSKRWGNIINPLDVIKQYGADTLRMYEMFLGPLDQMKAWNVESVSGVYRFLSRVWNSAQSAIGANTAQTNKEILATLHKTIKKVGADTESLKFNTAIASMMEFINVWERVGAVQITHDDLKNFIKILAPYAPFVTEEIWECLGQVDSIHKQSWPEFDESLLVQEAVEIPVQVNGRVRTVITVKTVDINNQEVVLAQAMDEEAVKKYVTTTPKKQIYVQGRVVNIIV